MMMSPESSVPMAASPMAPTPTRTRKRSASATVWKLPRADPVVYMLGHNEIADDISKMQPRLVAQPQPHYADGGYY
jgi:hypothetical protein